MEQKPMWIVDAILNNWKECVKHLRLVVQKDFLESSLRKEVCTKDVIALSRKIIGESLCDQSMRIHVEQKRIMRIRLNMKRS